MYGFDYADGILYSVGVLAFGLLGFAFTQSIGGVLLAIIGLLLTRVGVYVMEHDALNT